MIVLNFNPRSDLHYVNYPPRLLNWKTKESKKKIRHIMGLKSFSFPHAHGHWNEESMTITIILKLLQAIFLHFVAVSCQWLKWAPQFEGLDQLNGTPAKLFKAPVYVDFVVQRGSIWDRGSGLRTKPRRIIGKGWRDFRI